MTGQFTDSGAAEIHPTSFRNNWKQTACLFAAVGFIESLAFGHLSAFTPIYLRELHIAPVQVESWTGVLSALGFILGLPLLPFWTAWSDLYGRKIIIVRSSVFAAIIYGMFAAAHDVYWLAFARFLGGFVLGNTGVMMAVQADITPKEKLSSVIGAIGAASPIGMAVGPYLGGMMVERVGIRYLMWTDCALTALVILALIVRLKEEDRGHVKPASTLHGVRDALQAVFHTKSVRDLFLVIFLIAAGVSMTIPYTPIMVERLFHGHKTGLPTAIGAVLTASGVLMAAGTSLWGGLGARLDRLNILRFCAIVSAFTLLVQGLARSLPWFAAGRIAQGFVIGGLNAMAMVILATVTPADRRAAVLTLSLLPQQLAWFGGPLIGSALAPLGLNLVFLVGAGLVCVGVAASVRVHPVMRPDGQRT